MDRELARKTVCLCHPIRQATQAMAILADMRQVSAGPALARIGALVRVLRVQVGDPLGAMCTRVVALVGRTQYLALDIVGADFPVEAWKMVAIWLHGKANCTRYVELRNLDEEF